MKKIVIIPILSSISFAAQVSSRTPLKIDSIKFPKYEKPFIAASSEITKYDTAISKIYKMPVAKPKNPELYSGLKAVRKDTTLYEIPNLIDVAKPPKLSVK